MNPQFVEFVAETFAEDPTRAGVVCSYLEDGRYYMSVVRYHEAYAQNKEIVARATDADFSECFRSLVQEFEQWLTVQRSSSPPCSTTSSGQGADAK